MARTPNIRVPGRGAGRSIPQGYIIGRTSKGRGPLELLDQTTLAALGVATNKSVAPALHAAGFRFYVGGLPLTNEEIGSGVWGHDVSFQNGVDGSVITSLIAATSTAVWTIKVTVAGVLQSIGTITFAAGSTVGVLNWTAPVTISAGNPISLWAPNPQDATLASITGVVQGTS